MGRLFGTDGVRGIANAELDCPLAFKIGRASGACLADGKRRRPVFVIGGDTRASGGMLTASVISGLLSVGADVIDLGIIPTPAVSYLVEKYKADAGVVISASHNTYEYNGIKLFGGNGQKLPDMLEERIESLVSEADISFEKITGNDIGRVCRSKTAIKDYTDKIKSNTMFSLDGMRLAIDCANGAASTTAKEIFEGLGAKVSLLSSDPDGTNINRECGSTNPEALSRFVIEHKLDGGAAFDGDADRCICVDENGKICDGDKIMAVCALDLKERGRLNHNTVVGTVMTNLGLVKFLEENDMRFIATKVGDKFVLEEMLIGEYSFGGEQSGHIIFRDFASTGDGQLTAAQLFSLVNRSSKPLSELSSVMTPYPQITINLPVTAKGKLGFFTDPDISAAVNEAKAELQRDGRIVVRPSGTEPLIRIMAEGPDESAIFRITKQLEEVLCSLLEKYK